MTTLTHLPPTEQVYDSYVPPRYHGLAIEKYFARRFNYESEREWALRVAAGMITVNGRSVSPGFIVRDKDHIVTRLGLRVEPPADRSLKVLYQDRYLRIFNKGAPLPVHPSGRYYKNSMTELLKEVYPEEPPRPVQRLDSMTTGVIVFARDRETATDLMREFQGGRVHKEYLALVNGRPPQARLVIEAPIGRLAGSKRAVGADTLGPKPAVTEVEWLSTIDGWSLLKVLPRSGRTNQIRVHLSSRGWPVMNDPVYGRGGSPGAPSGLHAWRLGCGYRDRRVEVTAAPPRHFQPFLEAAWPAHRS